MHISGLDHRPAAQNARGAAGIPASPSQVQVSLRNKDIAPPHETNYSRWAVGEAPFPAPHLFVPLFSLVLSHLSAPSHVQIPNPDLASNTYIHIDSRGNSTPPSFRCATQIWPTCSLSLLPGRIFNNPRSYPMRTAPSSVSRPDESAAAVAVTRSQTRLCKELSA